MGSISIKDWSEFQHYKNRNPPWIKLHKSLLDNFKFQRLQAASRALAPMLWLLASESKDGMIPYNIPEIAFRCHRTEDEINEALTPLIEAGWVVVASDVLAECKQLATLEAEKRQRREETEAPIIPENSDQILWEIAKSYPKLSHLNNPTEIPMNVIEKIMQAVVVDGAEKVTRGTKGYSSSRKPEDREFCLAPEKFFGMFEYRNHLPKVLQPTPISESFAARNRQ